VFVVTGASGFIGRATVAALASRGLPVLAVSRRYVDLGKFIKTVQVTSYADLAVPMPACVLLHLAEPRHVGEAAHEDARLRAERHGALAALLAKGWTHVVYASSAVVYGDGGSAPRRVGEPIAPHGAYAATKAANEQAVLAAGGTVARLANVYGPGMASNNVLSDILRQIPGQGPVMLRDLAPVRDYLWVDDAAAGLVALAAARRGGVVNLGTGIGTSVGDLAGRALACAGEAGRPVVASETAGRTSYLVLDISDTAAQAGWSPEVALDDGLRRLMGRA
jgi:UDP-glucose 4-epimerase